MVFDSQRVEPGQEEVTLTVSLDAIKGAMATLHVQVVDAATNQPLARARVSAAGWFGGEGGPETKEDGRITLRDVRPGKVWLSASAKGYEQVRRQLRIEGGQELDLGPLPLFPAETMKGTVVDAEGKPVLIHIGAVDVDAGPDSMHMSVLGCRSESDGTFTLPRVGRRRYLLRVMDKERGCANLLVDATQGAPTDVRLRLQAARTVKVEKESTQLVSVTVRDANNLPVHHLQTSAKRDFELWLPAGRYTVDITDQVGGRSSTTLVVGAGDAVLRLP